MKSLFDFQETLDMVLHGVAELAAHGIETQQTTHKYSKKKDCKASFCIKLEVDGINPNQIFSCWINEVSMRYSCQVL